MSTTPARPNTEVVTERSRTMPTAPTLLNFLPVFFADRYGEKGGSHRSLTRYQGFVQRLNSALGEEITIDELSDDHLDRLGVYLRQKGSGEKTVEKYRGGLRVMARHARRHGYAVSSLTLPAWWDDWRPQNSYTRRATPQCPLGPLGPTTTITEWVEIYIGRRALEPTTERHYRCAARQFTRWYGKTLSIADAADCDLLNRHLLWLERGLERSAYTIYGRRTILLVLLDVASDDGLCPAIHRRKVRCPRRPALIPQCLTVKQAGRLIAACDPWDAYCRSTRYHRKLLPNGKPRGLFWKTFVATAWDTGFRLSDVLAIKREIIRPDGHLTIVQAKSGRQNRRQVHPETLALIDELMAGDERGPIFEMGCKHDQFYRHFKNLTTFAGVPCTTKWIRRGSASEYERHNPGQAWKHLGHSAPGLDRRFYLNPDIAYPEQPQVTSVFDLGKGGAS